MNETTRFRPYEPDQLLLMPPDLNEWLLNDHLAFFIREVARTLDLARIYESDDGAQRGRPAYYPRMMTGLLLYAYCVGLPSSRQIERATWESVPFRVLAADAHPDHDTIAPFRKRNLETLAGLFVQTLRLYRKAGLVKLGCVALDGTKVRANASKHKAISYERMKDKEVELEVEVERMLKEAEEVDTAEDELYGKGRRGDELPEDLRTKQLRLAKIRQAKQALEEEARAKAEEERNKRPEGTRGRKSNPPAGGARGKGATQLHRPRFADHEGRRDKAVRAKLQLPSGSGCRGPGDRGDGCHAGDQRHEAVDLHSGRRENEPEAEVEDGAGRCGLLQRRESSAFEKKEDRRVYRDGPGQARGDAVSGAGTDPEGCVVERADGPEVEDESRTGDLRGAEGDGGAGVRTDPGGPGLPAIPVAGLRQREPRVGDDLSNPQSAEVVQTRSTGVGGVTG
jgi:transposase